MRTKLIAFDLDGTLLHDDKTIAARSLRALQAARKPQTVLRSGFLKLMFWLNGPFRRAMKPGAKTLLIGAPGQYEQTIRNLEEDR